MGQTMIRPHLALIIVSANLNKDQPRSSRRTLRKPFLFEAFAVTLVLSVVSHSHKVAEVMIIALSPLHDDGRLSKALC